MRRRSNFVFAALLAMTLWLTPGGVAADFQYEGYVCVQGMEPMYFITAQETGYATTEEDGTAVLINGAKWCEPSDFEGDDQNPGDTDELVDQIVTILIRILNEILANN